LPVKRKLRSTSEKQESSDYAGATAPSEILSISRPKFHQGLTKVDQGAGHAQG
jgi:hypothetical protein